MWYREVFCFAVQLDLEENEMLWKLKEMEYVERIAEKIGEISISGGGNVIGQLKEIFVK